MTISFTNLFIIFLAAWRMASLLANEPGPFYMFGRLRDWTEQVDYRSKFWGDFHLQEGILCEYCNSVWIGAGLIVFWFVIGDRLLFFLLPLAVSTGVIVIKCAVEYLKYRKEDDVDNRLHYHPVRNVPEYADDHGQGWPREAKEDSRSTRLGMEG